MAYFTIEGYNSYSGCDITVTASLPSINDEPSTKYYTLGSLQTLSISTHQDKRPVRSLGVINAKDYVMGPRTIAGSMVFAVFNKHFATEIMNDLGAGTGTNVILPDEIPALNITVNFANEYGRMSRMAIYGVKILNEGQVMSINDLYTENTYQFVALGLEPLNINIDTGGGGTPGTPGEPGVIDGGEDYIIDPIEDIPINNMPALEENPALYGVTGLRNRILNYGYIGSDLVSLDTTNSTSAVLNNPYFLNNSGANVSEQIKNNTKAEKDNYLELNIKSKYNPIVLSVKVQQPMSVNDLGIATFTLEPEQDQGTIFIYPPNSKNINEDYTIEVTRKKILIISLPVGKYQAQYINVTSDTSNVVEFVVEKYVESSTQAINNIYPIIEKVTDTTITVSVTDRSHNTITYFEEGKNTNSLEINNNKTIKLTNLTPDTKYNIYTSDPTGIRSQIVTVKTYEEENEELLMFKDFISTNKDILVLLDEETGDLFDNIDYEKYHNLIDMVLTLPESSVKQEALIFATELANQLTTSHNISNNMHILDKFQSTPFDSSLNIKSFNVVNVYNNNNGKLTLNDKLHTNSEEFCGKPNKHYDICGISDKGLQSVKQSFTICKSSSSTELEKYHNMELYKDIDLSEYLQIYKKYRYNTVEYLAIKDRFYSDINILEPPYIYKSEDGELYADIKYLNLNKNESYYLCCAELYSALDYKPARKIKFDLETAVDNLELNKFYLGLIPKKQYLFWIENFQFIKISKPFLYVDNTTEEFKDLRLIYKQSLHSKILSLKKELLRQYGNKTVLDELFGFVNGLEPAQKNFNTVMISELINQLSNSYYVSNVMYPLFELLNILHDYTAMVNLPDILIDKKKRTVEFKDLKDYYICAIEFTDTSSEAKRLNDIKDIVQYSDEGYTMIYLASFNMIYKSGFILIDNAKNVYECTTDLLDFIEEVGDK